MFCLQDWNVLTKCDIMHHRKADTCKYSDVQVSWGEICKHNKTKIEVSYLLHVAIFGGDVLTHMIIVVLVVVLWRLSWLRCVRTILV